MGRSGCWLVRASIVGAMLQVKQGVTGAQQSRELFSDLREVSRKLKQALACVKNAFHRKE